MSAKPQAMKNVVLFALIIALTMSCSSSKNQIKINKIPKFSVLKNDTNYKFSEKYYSLIVPNSWMSYLESTSKEQIRHTPVNVDKSKCYFVVINYYPGNSKSFSLEKLARSNRIYYDLYKSQLHKKKGKYGEFYLKENLYNNGENKSLTQYVYNGEFIYVLRFYAKGKLYDKYLTDVVSIMDSFTVK